MTDSDPDVTEKVERTDVCFRLTVESTRGTGTRDQDKVKAELRTENPPSPHEQQEVANAVMARMNTLRANQPDEDGDTDG